MRLDAVGWQPHCLWGEARFDSGQARSMCRLIPDFNGHTKAWEGSAAPREEKLRFVGLRC